MRIRAARRGLLGVGTALAALLVITAPAQGAPANAHTGSAAVAPVAATTDGPFVTLLFSRSEVAAADRTPPVRDNRNIAGLVTVVAPFLASNGLVATATIQTATTKQSTVSFTHYGFTASISWDAASRLAGTYRLERSAPHQRDVPDELDQPATSRIWAETCGSAATIAAHGLPGSSGLYAWPSDKYVDAIQAAYVSTCIAFGRQYSKLPTTRTDALTPPYYQHTEGLNGGSCNDRTKPCWTVAGIPSHYDLPQAVIDRIRDTSSGQWFTLQAYVLVTGKNPAYQTNTTRWDCTSADPRQHWSNDNERYCWQDYQAIIRAIPSSAVVTDPLSVAHLWGRPGY